jgi:hypothetical protein
MEMNLLKTGIIREYLNFFIHLSVSAGLFLLILGATVGVSYFSNYLIGFGMATKMVAQTLEILKYSLFVVNIFLFTVSVLSQAIRMIRRTKMEINGIIPNKPNSADAKNHAAD